MSSGLSFAYGDYNFRPRPFFSIQSRPLKTPDGSGYGITHSVSLEGDLLLTGTTQLSSGILGVSEKIELLKDALDTDGRLLAISCNDSPIISGYPIVEGYAFDRESDNMTRRASYKIDFVMPTIKLGSGNDTFNNGTSFPPFIESATETWDVDFADERMPFDWQLLDGTDEKFGHKMAVTHTVNVVARKTYTGTEVGNIPWQDARDYAIDRLGFDAEFVTLTGVLGLPGTAYFSQQDVFNHFRQVSTDKTAGSIQVVETFIVTPSGSDSLPNNAIENFDINIGQEDGIATVGINGNIEGLASITYTGDGGSQNGFNVGSSKYSAASGYYNIIKDRLFQRAKTAYAAVSGSCFNRSLNATVRSRSVGINPIEGTISYDYTFDTIPSGCITGECILSQNISIDDTLASDVFATQTVLGRAQGPILQDIGTITASTRTVSIELVTLPPTDCSTVDAIYAPVPTGAVDDFIAVISGDLASANSQVFVSAQSQNWNFTIGRYTKTIAFTYNNCSS
jgi:hypothetical protein